MKQYPADLRERLLRAQDAGLAAVEIETRFGVDRSTLRRWRRRMAATGSSAPLARPGPARKIGDDAHGTLRAQVAARPDATLTEHCAAWEAAHGVRLSPATMCRALARLQLTLKKRPS